MKSLAVKYRPSHFNEVIGQDNIKKILGHQIKTGTYKNSYIFTGGAGTGKTTCARIFANVLNNFKGNPIEMDAASNNGVEHVRNIIDSANFKSITSDFKIYIIDECHMLTIAAWNAFLKLLEEPPEKTIFVFCTTDPQKIPATILSRSQRYDFQRIPTQLIVDRLKYIIAWENENAKYGDGGVLIADEDTYIIKEDVYEYIAKLSEGGMRDAITLLDKCLSYSVELDIQAVVNALGIVNYEDMFELVYGLINKDIKRSITVINYIYNDGKDLKNFIKQFIIFLTDMCKYQLFKDWNYIRIPSTYKEKLEPLSLNPEIKLYLREISSIYSKIKWETSSKSLIESEIILLCI